MVNHMEKFALLLLEHPSAVIESGVVIPCALRDLAAMALDDRMCMSRSEVADSFQEAGDELLHVVPLPPARELHS